MNKKGLSDVITTVLIILVVLASVVLIWVFISNILYGSGKFFVTSTTDIRLSVVPSSVVSNDSNLTVSFSAKKYEGITEMKSLVVVLQDSNGRAETFKQNFTLNDLESREVFIDYSGSGLVNVDKIYLAPIFDDSEGKELIGKESSPYKGLGISTCGDGIIEGHEQCDGINLDGKTCPSAHPMFVAGTLSCVPAGTRGQCAFNTTRCVSSDSLVSYHKFDGNLKDALGLNDLFTHPTSNVFFFFTSPVSGSSTFPMNLPNIYADIANTINFGDTNFSISIWVAPLNSVGGSIVSKDLAIVGYPGFYTGINPTDIRFKISNGTKVIEVVKSVPINPLVWTHIVAVRSDKLYLYLNGSLVATSANIPSSYSVNSATPVSFLGIVAPGQGTNVVNARNYAFIDESMIFNRALSDKEVKELYRQYVPE